MKFKSKPLKIENIENNNNSESDIAEVMRSLSPLPINHQTLNEDSDLENLTKLPSPSPIRKLCAYYLKSSSKKSVFLNQVRCIS